MENDIYRLDEKTDGDDPVDIIDYTNKLADSIQKKIDDIIMSGDTNAEVVDARGEFNTLGNRLDNVDKNIVISTKPFETNCDIEDSANSKIKFDKIIGGLVQETSDGYNLFNVNDTKAVSSGITVDEEDWITITCDNSSGTSAIYQNYFTNNLNLKENTNYNIIAEIKKVSGTGSIQIVSSSSTSQFDQSMGYLFSNLSNGQTVQLNKLTKSDFTNTTQGIRTFCSFNAGESGSITFRISVLEDTTITSDNFVYAKFGKSPSLNYPSELKYVGGNYDTEVSNKNLFNNVFIKGQYDIGGAGAIVDSSNRIRSNKIKVLPNTTYTISSNNSNLNFVGIGGWSINDTLVQKVNDGVWNSFPVSFTTNSDVEYLGFNFRKDDNSDIIPNGDYQIQLEQSSTATDYIEHQEQIYPLDLINHPLYSDKDCIYKKDDKRFVHNEWNRIVLDGKTNKFIGKIATTNNNQFAMSIIDNILKPSTNSIEIKLYSNCFNSTYTNNIYLNNIEGISISINGQINIGFGLDSGINTLELANAKLQELYNAGTPVEVIYPLATPTETEITNATLINQLEAIANMKTYKGGTHITFDDIGKIKGEYVVDNGLAEAVQEFNEINNHTDEEIAKLKESNVYSTEETICGSYKEKPLYRKHLEFTTGDVNNSNFIMLIPNIDNFMIKSCRIGAEQRPYNYAIENNKCVLDFLIYSNALTYRTLGTGGANTLVNLDVEYTKITD